MSNFRIIFEKKLIYRSKRGAVTAPVYFDWGEYQFPEKGWSDFVVVVLSWWVEAFSRLVCGWETEVEFSFMDGPMLIRLRLAENGMVTMQCVNQRNTQEMIEYRAIISLSELRSQLKSIASQVLRACDENIWESDDIRSLRKGLGIIEEI